MDLTKNYTPAERLAVKFIAVVAVVAVIVVSVSLIVRVLEPTPKQIVEKKCEMWHGLLSECSLYRREVIWWWPGTERPTPTHDTLNVLYSICRDSTDFYDSLYFSIQKQELIIKINQHISK